jgi:type 1 fimbriae regulatory protein FimB
MPFPGFFVSKHEQPLTRQSVNYLVAAAAARAELPPVHPHMLPHSCGFSLANHDLRLIQDYLGHRDPKQTVRYTRTAAGRFEGALALNESKRGHFARLRCHWADRWSG